MTNQNFEDIAIFFSGLFFRSKRFHKEFFADFSYALVTYCYLVYKYFKFVSIETRVFFNQYDLLIHLCDDIGKNSRVSFDKNSKYFC